MGKYSSRKFIVVGSIALITAGLAIAGKMTGDVASVFTGIVVVYPAAQGFVDGKATQL